MVRLRKKHLLLLSAFLGISLLHATESWARIPQYRAVQRIALSLLETCPPDDCIMVFPGRSGTAVAAYLEAFLGNSSVQIPLTDFRYNPAGGPDGKTRSLSPTEEKKLFDHFDRFIDRSRLFGKRVITVDYSLSGRSQLGFTAYLNRWLKEGGEGPRAVAVPIADETNWFEIEMNAREYGVEIGKSVKPGAAVNLEFAAENYDSASAYGPYKIFEARNEPPLTKSREYMNLVAEMTARQDESRVIVKVKSQGIRSNAAGSFRSKLKSLMRWICGETLRPELASLDGESSR